MKITWYWPDPPVTVIDARPMLNGDLRINVPLTQPGEEATYATIRDQLFGYHVVRVDFDGENRAERQQIMETMLEAARIQYNERYYQ